MHHGLIKNEINELTAPERLERDSQLAKLLQLLRLNEEEHYAGFRKAAEQGSTQAPLELKKSMDSVTEIQEEFKNYQESEEDIEKS